MKHFATLILFALFGLSSLNAQAEMGEYTEHAREKARALCDRYYSWNDKQACYSELRDSRFQNEAVNLCMDYYSLGDKKACLLKTADKRFHSFSLQVCLDYYSLGDKVSCLEEVGNLDLDARAQSLCSDRYSLGDKKSCIVSLGIPVRDGRHQRQRIIRQVESAISDIEADKVQKAKGTLQELLRQLRRGNRH